MERKSNGMKVFISWSGDISGKVARMLRDWLPSVIQSLEPHVSSEDIDKGRRWIADISGELEHSAFGILCVTKDSKDAPWLIFEAGALSKSVKQSRVAPFLFGVELSEIKEGPLSQFQATRFDKDDVNKLVHSLNSAGDVPSLDKGRLDNTFSRWWPELEAKLNEIKVSEPEAEEGTPSFQGKDADTSSQTVQQDAEEAKRLIGEIREIHSEARERLTELTAEGASQKPEEAARTVASVQRDPAASLIDRAIAAAVLLQQQGKIEGAIEKWRSIANVAGEEDRHLQAQAWFSIGHLRSQGERVDWEAVLAASARAIELKPDLAEAYNNRGVAKINLGHYEAALADYDQAIRLKPAYVMAYTNRGGAKNELGRPEAALADLDQAIELKPDLADAYNNRGNAKKDLGRPEAALADYDQAIRLKPDYANAYSNRGNAKKDLGRPEAALADYDQAIRLKPDYANAYSNRGGAKKDLGRPEAALADYDQAIRLKPDYANAYSNRGGANMNLGRITEAREDFQKTLVLAQASGNEKLVKAVQRTLSYLDNNEAP